MDRRSEVFIMQIENKSHGSVLERKRICDGLSLSDFQDEEVNDKRQ